MYVNNFDNSSNLQTRKKITGGNALWQMKQEEMDGTTILLEY